MASARFAWGIDIGNRALKAIKLVRGEGGLRIDDFEVIEHENVLSNAGDNKEALIQSALANFVQRHAIKGGVAAISVSGVSSFARFIKLPPVEPKKIPEIVRFEAIQQIPFPLDDVEWSYQLFQTPESPDVEVGIFAMRRELVNAHIKHFTDVDLNVQVVQMNPLAVYNAMYHDNRLQGTTMIIDLGAENTDLIIADGETIWLRSIPIGGNNFTEVLVKSFKLPFNKAEDLKRNANTSKYARQIFQAMRPVFADLVAEIQRSIGFYSSVHRESRIKKVLALGGTFRLAGLQKYLQQNLQLDVEKLNELTAGAPADAKLAATFNQNLLSLVSAYGLAIQAMGDSKITSSLLPMKIRREKMWRDKTKWFGAAAAIFVLGTGMSLLGYYLRDLEYKSAADIRENRIDPILRQATDLSDAWRDKVEGNGATDRMTIQNVRSMLEGRGLWINLLGDVFASLPPVPTGYPTAEYLKTHPRPTRNIILIDKIESTYYPDLLQALTAAPPELAMAPAVAGQPPSDPAIPSGSRGFIITISITTPHKDGFLLALTSFIPNLKKHDRAAMDAWNTANPKNPKTYYIAKVSAPMQQVRISDDPTRIQQMQASYTDAQNLLGVKPGDQQPAVNPTGRSPYGGYGGPPGYGRFGGLPRGYIPQPANQPAGNAPGMDNGMYIDRLTQEDRRDDWEMKVELIVVIDPSPQAPAAPASPQSP
ncbi:MAG TPA: type IV pilus assembly protein PilM [Tepidisphaeraceae bacterium]|jgi:type IV pilus assembly protein PilM|nr:type IV pilus assembly protein PilM [Tepidisphaeraceae bacterium]